MKFRLAQCLKGLVKSEPKETAWLPRKEIQQLRKLDIAHAKAEKLKHGRK